MRNDLNELLTVPLSYILGSVIALIDDDGETAGTAEVIGVQKIWGLASRFIGKDSKTQLVIKGGKRRLVLHLNPRENYAETRHAI